MKYICFFLVLLACQSLQKGEIGKKTNYHLQMAKGHLINCVYPQALFHVKEALKIEPESYIVHDALGVVYGVIKQYDQAKKHFQKALYLKPQYTESKMNLARVLMDQKKEQKALPYLQSASKDLTYINPSKIYSWMGEVYFNQKKYDLSLKNLKTSLQMNPKNCLSLFLHGRVEALKNNHRRAVHFFKKVNQCQNQMKTRTKCSKKQPDFYYFQALSEAEIGRKKSAVKNLKLFLKKTESVNPYYNLAKKLLKKLES